MAEDLEDVEDLFKKAAQIAEVLPESMQAAGFHRALDLLLEGRTVRAPGPENGPDGKNTAGIEKRAKRARKPRGKKLHQKATPKLMKDLNLRPADQESFPEFASKKGPTSDHERKLVSVYYLERILELDAVTVDHVYTCFKSAGWRIPTGLSTSLMLTASKKGWLDTSDMTNISVTISGENFLEYELPKASKADKGA